MQVVEQDYAAAEQEYNFATATYNESNLQFTKTAKQGRFT